MSTVLAASLLCYYVFLPVFYGYTTPAAVSEVNTTNKMIFSSAEAEKTIKSISDGDKVMVIMRGLPGSGKSTLAKLIIDRTRNGDYRTHLFTSDDYHMVDGVYKFRLDHMGKAHTWNQNKVKDAACKGVNPIVVDSTNKRVIEMKPYAEIAISNGYRIDVVESATPWAFNVTELSQRNVHQVSTETIEFMLQIYERNVTAEKIIDLLSPKNLIDDTCKRL